MAERVQEQKEEKKHRGKKSKGNCAVQEVGAGEFGSVTEVQCRPVKITRVAGKAGLKELRQLAAFALWRSGVDAAMDLVNCAIEGEEGSVRALMTMLEPREKETREAPQGRSLAEIWAAEPRWVESSEETAEVGAGSREPEE